MIDSHLHLSDSQFDIDRYNLIDNCLSKNFKSFLEILCSADDWDKYHLFEKYADYFYFAFGIHPEYPSHLNDNNLRMLEKYLNIKNAIAVGEIGIDLWYYPDSIGQQLQLMEAQVDIANRLKKPLIFHIRNPRESNKAYDEFFAFIKTRIKNSMEIPAVIHSFSGTLEDVSKALDLGFMIGINATLTYPKNQILRDAVKKAGIKNILTETDSPYLPPQSSRGKRNNPSNIAEIIRKISEILEIPFKEIEMQTEENFKRFTRIFYS
ncbi:MAG: TatD family hydrolase [Elusimicrobiales bacterium]|jgi:TatD DNase family protein|nr:TatD family hydrolase [Elusimicrobiales bacterium]